MGQDSNPTEEVADAPLTSSVTAEPARGGPEVLDLNAAMDPSMPDVQEHTVRAAREARAAAAQPEQGPANSTVSPVKGKTDDQGRPFDSSLHEVGSDGKPAINARGFLKKKRGGAAQQAARGKAPSYSKTPDAAAAAKEAKKTQEAAELEAKVQSTAQMS